MPSDTTEATRVAFFVPGIPRPGGSKKGFLHRHTKRIIITDDAKGNREWKQSVALFASQAFKGEPLTGPLEAVVTFFLPRPKSHYRTGRHCVGLKPGSPIYHTNKPDATKLWRSTEDAMAGIIFADDSSIAMQTVTKVYNNTPGAWISIKRLTGSAATSPEAA
jgi:crossover junction endodeoxyribonuclease RusA